MKTLVKWIFKYKKTILVMTGVLTLFFGYGLTKIKINSDIIGYLPKTDPAVMAFNHAGDVFSGNDLALVAVESDDVFSPQTVQNIKKLTDAFKEIQGVSAVTSITNILDIRKGADGSVEVGKLIDADNLPATPADYAKIRDYALNKDLYKGRLVSTDGKTTLVVVRLAANVEKAEVTRQVKKTALAAKLPEKLYFGGVPFITLELSDAIFSDLKALIPLVCILVILTLYWSFRNMRGVWVPFVSVLVSTIWTLGFMSWMKVPLSMISDVIPVLLIAVGTAPCIHILSKYDEKLSRYGSDSPEVQEAFAEVGLRVILTELTIILGFTSFIFGSYLTMIREFGIFTALGTLFVMIIATLSVPAALSFLHVKPKSGQEQNQDSEEVVKPVKGFMHSFSQFILNNEWSIVIVWLVVFVAMGLGTLRIERKVNVVEFFKPEKDIRKAENVMVNRFGGSEPIQVLFKGDMQNPYVLKELRRMDHYLESIENVNNAQSVASLVAEVSDSMTDDKTIPDTHDKVANLWFFLDGQELLPQMVSSDLTEGVSQAMVATRDTKQVKTILNDLEQRMNAVPKSVVAVNMADVHVDARPMVFSYLAGRTAESLEWDIQKYDHAMRLDKPVVAKAIVAAMSAAAQDPKANGRIDPQRLMQDLLLMMPEEVRGDFRWKNTGINELKELNDSIIYLPEAMYPKLGISGKPEPEKISLGLTYTGMPLIYQHLDQSLLDSQVESFAIALVFIYILLALQLRSFAGGLIGLMPIVLTVFITFGFMGFTHIPLDVATVLVASVALGIGIDYAIHFCMRFKHYFELSSDLGMALENTLHTTGHAIIINVVSVTMGFLTLMVADLIPLKRFGLLVSLTMVISGLASITLLPSMIILTKAGFVGRWDRIQDRIHKKITKRMANRGGGRPLIRK